MHASFSNNTIQNVAASNWLTDIDDSVWKRTDYDKHPAVVAHEDCCAKFAQLLLP